MTSAPHAGESVKYYRAVLRGLAVVTMSLFVLAFAMALVAGPTMRTLASTGAALLFGAVTFWQAWHNCVILTPTEVVIHNNRATHRLPWDQVSTAGRTAGRFVGEQVVIYTTDGRTVQCRAFVGWAFGDGPLGQDLIDAIKLRVGRRG